MPQSPRRPFDPSVEKRALRRSSPLVAAYRKLYGEYQAKPAARRRLAEILTRVDTAPKPGAGKGGQ